MSKQTIKWAILGPGGISSTFAKDLAYAEGAELIAVGGRNLEKAERFAKEYNIPRAYGSVDQLAGDEDVDIVYVGTLHPAHKDNVLAMLRAGKAVLCEKPFCMNAAEAKEMIEAAGENKVFLMEAMWTRYLPPIVKVREWIAEGRIGEVRLLKADFGFNIGWQPQSRLLDPALGGGALLDAGIYPVSFASMIFGGQPSKIMSSARIGETGVDEQFSLLFEYEGGRAAALNGAVQLGMVSDAYIYGTKGHIHVPNFLFGKSASLHVAQEEPVKFEDDRQSKGYAFEAEEAMACLREGRLESSVMPLRETLDIMATLDEIRRQWGLRYPADE
ncbi:Gfo/Idh/MocA family protein [Paenibacillus arenilitoris]|uniref:Gfo/Idh/MocA family oxidoreductase n=1 Tax=Paenibacillus arenilitoris TaxID=2772299 RepID=A0A927CLI9_9BACL|nr:Gfo/Idh/MocA family oxidoreductase [Paenibacillus arenilitoris]MBD2870254.1 Gfo/Idh/MocA family oxidoreductase [Paenibacillus arenilitoris]